tara:strand:+ start:127 stop:570 length:444 start_codon:yes stop_codon:yes gene_type:complete
MLSGAVYSQIKFLEMETRLSDSNLELIEELMDSVIDTDNAALVGSYSIFKEDLLYMRLHLTVAKTHNKYISFFLEKRGADAKTVKGYGLDMIKLNFKDAISYGENILHKQAGLANPMMYYGLNRADKRKAQRILSNTESLIRSMKRI